MGRKKKKVAQKKEAALFPVESNIINVVMGMKNQMDAIDAKLASFVNGIKMGRGIPPEYILDVSKRAFVAPAPKQKKQ